MKKQYVLLFFATLVLTNKTFAQKDITFSINAGLTYSSLFGNEFANQLDSEFDFLVGVGMNYLLTENLSLKTELNYERMKSSLISELINTNGLPNGKLTSYAKTTYLTIPLMVKYNHDGFFVNGGPFVGILLSSKTIAENNQIDNSEGLKAVNFGISLGLGKEFKINDSNSFIIEIRDNFGLMNTSNIPVYRNGSVKTNSVNLILSWNFSFTN
ncbi:porin family protein [Tenacibaculum xiamenense]|uniref:porin family protein n=1 Tax=Tenacibaculum xiamenense TaxID=1261553 RepID=UPI003895F264